MFSTGWRWQIVLINFNVFIRYYMIGFSEYYMVFISMRLFV